MSKSDLLHLCLPPLESTSRGRSSSILRPSWLWRKSQTSSQKRPPSPKSIGTLFAHFSQRSYTPDLDPLSKYIVRSHTLCLSLYLCASRQSAPVAPLRPCSLQDHHWSEVCSDSGECSESVAKYRNAVWDLFQEECKYLTRQLKPLEQVSLIRELCHVMSSPSRLIESHYVPCWYTRR